MEEQDLKIFIESVAHYFDQIFGEQAVVDPPFLGGKALPLLDFTGVIGISGKQQGAVYFTADRAMIADMLSSLGEDPLDESFQADIVGEVANTIAGNARREFGGDFLISVPMVLRGAPESFSLPRNTQAFVIPFAWRHHRSFLITALASGPNSPRRSTA
ncbi:MAG: chemotaxis protein CheX [Verrucomicrobiia bacterium]